jgi:hypothetical protein
MFRRAASTRHILFLTLDFQSASNCASPHPSPLGTVRAQAGRPDIVSRVFRLKLEELRRDLRARQVLGEPVAHSVVVEWQKRGLPHVHIRFLTGHPQVCDYNEGALRLHGLRHASQRQGRQAREVDNERRPLADNRYRDAMATVGRYGTPSFFITMPCNPDWSVRGHRASKRALKTTNCRIFLSLPIKLALARWQVCASIRALTYLYKYVYKEPPHDLDRSQVRPLGDARPPSVPCVAPATFGPFSQQFWNLWPELPPDLPTVLPVHPTSVDHQAPSFFTPPTRNPGWPATSDDPQRGQQRFHRYRAPLHQRVRGSVRAQTGGGWRSAWPGGNFVSES